MIGEKSGPGPHCPRCLRTVYDAERAIGLNDVSTKLEDHLGFLQVPFTVKLRIRTTNPIKNDLKSGIFLDLFYSASIFFMKGVFRNSLM